VNKKIQAVKWNKTLVSQVLRNPLHHRPEDEVWRMGVSVVSQAGDICGVKSWIVFRTTVCLFFVLWWLQFTPCLLQDVLQIGRIAEIVVAETTDHSRSLKTSYVTLDTFILAEERHPQYGLPFLRRPEQDSRTPKYQVIQPKVSAMHWRKNFQLILDTLGHPIHYFRPTWLSDGQMWGIGFSYSGSRTSGFIAHWETDRTLQRWPLYR